VIFKGFTYDIGFPLLRGGRYDRLVEKFGAEMPATGFSMGVNMLMTALERQGIELEKPAVDTIVGYEEGERQTAIELCSEFRRQGLNVELDLAGKGKKAIEKYAARKNIKGYIFVSKPDEIEVCNLENGVVNRVNPNELISNGNGGCG
ncbi:MAG: ATP phosphoribosyltransferase regulatory subunit, partial [Eubacteriales bacterium]|nr:ATP phosphoribosyltransferase regulatory subunit [Eubacteriales bacterium]